MMMKRMLRGVLAAMGATILVAPVTMALTPVNAAEPAATWTQGRALDYAKAFNDETPRFASFFTDDIVYPHISAGVMHGPKEILNFYETHFWNGGVKETRVPKTIIIDNADHVMAIEFRMYFTAKPGHGDAKLPTGEVLKQGEKWQGSSVIIYGLRGDKISSIRGALNGPGKIERIEPK